MAHHQKIKNTDHLKQVLNSCWDMMSQELLNRATDQWSRQLLLVVCSQGELIKHRFHLFSDVCWLQTLFLSRRCPVKM